MNPIVLSGIMTAVFLLLIVIGLPMAFAMAITGGLGIVFLGGIPTVLYTLGTYPVSYVGSFALTVAPLFVLMGNLAAAAGMATDAFNMAAKWLSWFKGGLVMVTIVACGLMAATTGSSVAEVALMSRIAIPEMRKHGYDLRLAAGSVCCASSLGILIPPSFSFVIYGIVTEQSIGKLFIAGIFPGILTIVLYMGMVYVRCSINPALAPRVEARISWKDRVSSLNSAWGVVVLFVSVVGALYFGIATPTEVAALGCLVALVIQFIAMARGKSSWALLKEALTSTMSTSAMVFAFMIGASLYSLFITLSGVTSWLVTFVVGLQVSRLVILLFILALYLPLGMFLDPLGMILITVPIVYPVLVYGLHYDPIWFGVVLVILIEISMVTPPVAINLYVVKQVVPDIPLNDIFVGSIWFLTMELVALGILIAFPQICTWLPSTMG